MVGPADRRAHPTGAPVGEDRSLQPRLRSTGPPIAVLGDRQPPEPLVAHPRTHGGALLRRVAARPRRVPWDPSDQPGGGLPLREVQGSPARALRAAARALSACNGREPP